MRSGLRSGLGGGVGRIQVGAGGGHWLLWPGFGHLGFDFLQRPPQQAEQAGPLENRPLTFLRLVSARTLGGLSRDDRWLGSGSHSPGGSQPSGAPRGRNPYLDDPLAIS